MRKLLFCLPLILSSMLQAQPQKSVTPQDAEDDLQEDLNQLQKQKAQSIPAPVKAASNLVLGERDPFRVPNYLEELELEFLERNNTDNVDNSVEAIKRWPLAQYKVVAIIWNVNDPKAMITDRRGTMHMVKKNYQIGNKGGLITSIKDGEIVVTEKGVPIVLKLTKDGSELKSDD